MKIQEFDFSIAVTRSLLWRHNQAVNLQGLINFKQAAIDDLNEDFWTAWVTDVFDLTTANEFGLNVWAIILDLPIRISSVPPTLNANFGFGSFRKNFSWGNYATTNIALTVEEARIALRLRYYQLMTRATVTEANQIINDVFTALGTGYVLDGLDMTCTYVFDFTIEANLLDVIKDNDLLPRPSAVEVQIQMP